MRWGGRSQEKVPAQPELLDCGSYNKRRCLAVAPTTVLRATLCKKAQYAGMVDMGLVEQRYPNIDVKQTTQIKCPLDPSNREHVRW